MPAPLSNAGCGTQPFRTQRYEQWARTEIDLAPAGRHVGHIQLMRDEPRKPLFIVRQS